MSTEDPLITSKAQHYKIAIDHAKRGSKDITGTVVHNTDGTIQQVETDLSDKKAHEEVRRQQAQNQ